MNAQELTKEYNDMSNRLIEAERQIEYLTLELEKQRTIINDMQIDVKMLQRSGR